MIIFEARLIRRCSFLLVALFSVFLVSCGSTNKPEANVPDEPDQADSSADQTGPLKDLLLGPLPEFELTDQTGNAFGTKQLRHRAWVANFIFTRCPATCPKQTEKLTELQQRLKEHSRWDEIRLVSFTVDPEYDSPKVLYDYGQKANADQQHWKFLTGSPDAIWQLSRDGFKLPVGEAADSEMPIFHSAKFVLVDPYLRIRGFYDVLEEDLDRLEQDLNVVLIEKAPIPQEIFDPPWLEERKKAQLATKSKFKVFHEFSFDDRREESGIGFRNKIVDDGAGKTYKPVHYDHGTGIAAADVDGDGLLDLYFVTQAGPNQLWRNLGDGRFEEITSSAGVAIEDRIGVTASFADIDNDGDADLYVTTIRGGNVMLENDGNGKFTDISAAAGLGHRGHSSGAVFFDYDRDGLLDVFLCNVGKYTSDEVAKVTMHQVRGEDEDAQYEFYVGFEDAFAGHMEGKNRNERSLLFHNMGDNRFEDVTEQMKIVDESWTGDASPVDFNNDGWPDLYLLNMQGHDQYYVNREGKYFEKKSREVFPKTSWGAMGIKTFDYDNDGDMDLMVTDMHSDMSEDIGPDREKLKSNMQWPESLLQSGGNSIWGNAFFRNKGDGTFEEVSQQIGAENYWPWGFSVGDLNADGFDDVFIASSMNYPFRYGVNTVLLNNVGNEFLDSEFILGVEPRKGPLAEPWFELDLDEADADHKLAKERSGRVVVWSALGSRASVILDLDEDGDLDIVTNEFNSRPMVLVSNLSESKDPLNYLKINLRGTKSNRDGLGGVVRLRAGEQTFVKVHDGQSGYLSQSLYPLYFGLGDVNQVDEIEVTWPSGTRQVFPGPIEANQVVTVIENDTP